MSAGNMPIFLKVLSYKGRSSEKSLSASFDQQGGTFGRSAKNHFVLDDPENIVSARHAIIKYENGCYYITDKSTNGTYIYSTDQVLQYDETILLRDGERLEVGDYNLIVHIDNEKVSPPVTPKPPVPPTPPDPKPMKIDIISIEDFEDDNEIEKSHSKPEPIQTEPKGAYDELLSVFFEAAKIEDTRGFHNEDIPELMRTVGSVLRELVDGLITILSGRKVTKKGFGVPVTVIQPNENNPLKFAPNGEEALKLMLTKKHRGFINAVDAVKEGYEDITNHHVAFHAGVTESLKRVIERFDPEKLAQQHQEGIVLKNAKRWEAYCQTYDKIAREAIENFFGDEFSRTYERLTQKSDVIHKNRLDDSEELADV